MQQQLGIGNKEALTANIISHYVKISADISDSVNQKRLIHCPCFIGGFHLIYRALATFDFSIVTHESFPKGQDV